MKIERANRLNELGEFGLINLIKQWTPKSGAVKAGIGDDAAVIETEGQRDILFTTDMLIENKHFTLKQASAYEIGWKALAVNVSDIAAMGGLPTFAVVSVGLPKTLRASFVVELYQGLLAVARRFKFDIVGGDSNRSDKIVISAALLGVVEKDKAILRSGAKNGDVIFVTGALGGSYSSKKHLNFVPKVGDARYLNKNYKIHAMMDISDGVASDIYRIAEASGVGAEIAINKLPLSKHATDSKAALGDGEDFELMFTLPQSEARRIKNDPRTKKYFEIGRIVKKNLGVHLVDDAGKRRPLKNQGFDHFK